MSAGGESTKVIMFALVANLGIAIAKFGGAFLTGSASMLAEAIHSLVDTSNQVLLLIGSKRSRKAPSETHPLGYGREAFFWSFVVAILLFSLGGLFAIYEGVHKLSDHGEISSPGIALGILALSIGLEGFSFGACLKEVRTQNRYGSLWEWFRKTTSSELLVVLTEDAAAMLGLLIAAGSLAISMVTGNPVWDAVGSIAVGAVLVVVAILLAVEIKSLMIGEAPATDYRPHFEAEVARHLPEARVLRLIALQTGASETLVSMKIHPGATTDVKALVEGINAFERATKKSFPEIRWLFVEPDFTD